MNDWRFGLVESTYVGFHVLLLGLLTWATGQRFLLPSLGPSVFALSTLPDHEMNYPQRVVVGQFVAILAGFCATQLLLGGLTAGPQVPPLSMEGIRHVGATLLAVVGTTVGMYATESQHPPAYATTLIVSTGVLTRLTQLLVFLLGVLVVIGVHEASKRVGPWNLPYGYLDR